MTFDRHLAGQGHYATKDFFDYLHTCATTKTHDSKRDNWLIAPAAFNLERDPLHEAGELFEAAHPHAIADENVVERGVDRSEERRARRAAVGRTQRGAGLIEATIGPCVVAAEAMEVAAVHAGLSSC